MTFSVNAMDLAEMSSLEDLKLEKESDHGDASNQPSPAKPSKLFSSCNNPEAVRLSVRCKAKIEKYLGNSDQNDNAL